MNLLKCCATAIVVSFVATIAYGVGPYRVTNLGTIAGGNDSDARGINAGGQVVGRSNSPNGFRAFLWSPGHSNGTTGSMVDLGTLAGNDSFAQSINSRGQVSGQSTNDVAWPYSGFLWTPDSTNGTVGSMIDLGSLGRASDYTFAGGINSQGQITGRGRSQMGDRAFLWMPATPNSAIGSMFALDGTPSGILEAGGVDINSAGQIVGNGQTLDNSVSFLWTPTTSNGTTGVMTVLAELPIQSLPIALNDSGQIVGAYGRLIFSTHAFLWSPFEPNGSVGGMIDLGILPGTEYSWAYDINSQGQVVGHSIIPYERYRAFIWTPSVPNGDEGTMFDLNSLLEPNTGTGWQIGTATGINDRGQIAGNGSYDPDGPGGIDAIHRAVLLTPVPEPSTALIGLFGASAFLRRQNFTRRRSRVVAR